MQENDTLERYVRQMNLPEIGQEGQDKLAQARVLVVGAGGLGVPNLQYLAASGIGHLGIIDGDKVSLSNLHRQVLYRESDVHKMKVAVAAQHLKDLNRHIHITTYPDYLRRENVLDIFPEYDIVIDGTDQIPVRYLINDACYKVGIPFIYGSIYRFDGQVSALNVPLEDGTRSSNYRDIFPIPPAANAIPDCNEGGVIGPLPGLIGTIQAIQVLQYLLSGNCSLTNTLLMVEGLTMDFRKIKIKILHENPLYHQEPELTPLIDYEAFCSSTSTLNQPMKSVTVIQLKKMLDAGEDIQVIDVREPYEYDIVNIGALLMPMSQIGHFIDDISRDKPVIVHCRSGKRSGDIIDWLESQHDFDNLYNLEGGILAWADEIDPSLPKY
ncbi:MAG: ThiF family adenylyltransferase [Saprospiraceae bacterium]|nr:ThiF family adenylyltransferase [Saprospiraceae bacterium]